MLSRRKWVSFCQKDCDFLPGYADYSVSYGIKSRQCVEQVDFPEPEGPMIDVNWPS